MAASPEFRVFRYGFARPKESQWQYFVNTKSKEIARVDRIQLEKIGKSADGGVVFQKSIIERFSIGDHVIIKLKKEKDSEAEILRFIRTKECPLAMIVQWVGSNGRSYIDKKLFSVCSIDQKIEIDESDYSTETISPE